MRSLNRPILFVEDDPGDSQLIRRAFDKAGITTSNLIRAKDGDDAVAYLDGKAPYEDRGQFPLPSLVLLDIKLPRRSGFEVLSWIRRDARPLRRTPVLMLTSSRHSVDINRAYELGANAYAVKPDTHGELVQLLQSIKQFWLEQNEFPVVQSATSETPAKPEQATDSRRSILIVEDERTDAALIIRALERAGFDGKIQHAIDGRSALDNLKARAITGELPSVLLLDLKLPGISGFELLEQIRATPNLKQIPVVVLAAAHDSESINKAYERGANSYLVKSADPDEVNRLMMFMQHYWVSVNRTQSGRTAMDLNKNPGRR